MGNSRVRNVQQWAVGITTAPRKKCTLYQTLSSLRAAGWDSPRLFVEPSTEIPAEFNQLPISQRDETLGAFPNWYLALTELVLRNPRADAYMLCQDDVLFATNLRNYLEFSLWPAKQIGVVSIYCPSHYPEAAVPGFIQEDKGWDSWGALVYIFSNPSARSILSDLVVLNHRDFGPAEGLRNIDSVVGYWCESNQLPYYVHSPSLAQHIGEFSTLSPNAKVSGNRQAINFRDSIEFNSKSDKQQIHAISFDQQIAEIKHSQYYDVDLSNPKPFAFKRSSRQSNKKSQNTTLEYDVDVFIPYFHNLYLLPQTIDSILWQLNVRPLIHLVNDCSQEDDSALKQKYAGIPNIRWYKTRQNCGPYKIANALFYFMASETIAIFDSDDIMLPEHLEKALCALDEYEADVYGSSMRQFLNPHEKPSDRSIKMLEDIPTLVSGTLSKRLKYPLVINGTMVIRKKTFEAANGFDGNMFCGADTEFIQRLQYPSDMQAKIHTSDEITALRRICNNSLSNSPGKYGADSPYRDRIRSERESRYKLWESQGFIDPRNFGTLSSQSDVLDKVDQLNHSADEQDSDMFVDRVREIRRNKNVTACLASIPSRKEALSKTVASLIDQVDTLKIHLNGYASIPSFLNHPKIEVVLGSNLLGGNTKFYFVDNLHGYVFTCDDDLHYPPNYVKEMQRGINTYRCLVGASGNSISEPFPLTSYLKGLKNHPLQREIPEDTDTDTIGTGTLGWHTEDLQLKFSDMIYRNMIDISLLRVALRDRIPRKIIRHPHKWITRTTNDHGLHEQNIADDSLSTKTINDVLATYPEKVYTGKRITVVLINYKRMKNTNQIIDSLRKQTVPPIIYVWNNGNEPFENPHVDWVINSNRNVHGHPLQFLYQYADTEYICRMDDDLVPADDRVFEDVIRFMSNHGKSQRIVGGFGVVLEEGKNYKESTHVGCGPHYKPIESDTPVDVVKGRIMWFRQEFAEEIPFEKSHVHVDLTTSLGLSKGRRLFHIIPQFLEGRLQELEELYDDGGGSGYSRKADHYELRNQLTQSWIQEC